MFSCMEEEEPFVPEAVEVPIDGTLDLHTFQPRELKTLLPDYFQACRDRGIYNVRVVHGKGTGALRRSVHALLDRMEGIESYRLGGMGEGSWGATLVVLKSEG
ncbi:MAG: Smr/MutS family protein [Candidatus Latescibacterota bacterium]